jgi:hypothetical protein
MINIIGNTIGSFRRTIIKMIWGTPSTKNWGESTENWG